MKRILSALLPVLLLLVGAAFIVQGRIDQNRSPQAPPDISAPVVAKEGQSPTGARQGIARIGSADDSSEQVQMDLKKMDANSLYLPQIGAYGRIDASTGSIRNGGLTLPSADKVTRWQGGADVKDEAGTILMAGHVNENHVRGVIYHMAELKPGNLAYVKDSNGRTGVYQLQRMDSIKKSALPASLWTKKGPKRLAVVTCGGELRRVGGSWHFDSNIVAIFTPVTSK